MARRLSSPPIVAIGGLIALCLFAEPGTTAEAADSLDYSVADPALKVVRLDTAPTESFLAVRGDAAGRLFVGGREGLFVYEPDGQGGLAPRRRLLILPNHTWVYDIEVRGNDLYLMTVSALYLVPDGVTKREGLELRRLIWGVPMGHVHQCFHAMAWGPEGDLYFSMGDPITYYGDFNRPDHWCHWTFFSQPDGTRTPYTGVGGVFRCKPDGSDFRVVARGLRNSCGLCFDRDWNLFSNDNDHESLPGMYVPGRLNYVTPHADFSWPRGWTRGRTPERADLLDTMSETLGRFVPVLQSYYDEAFLPESFRDNLLVARWCTRSIPRYPLKHRGASFTCEEQPLLIGRNNARPVGVTVGMDGRIYATISYMAHNEASPVYKSDLVVITRAEDAAVRPVRPYAPASASPETLWVELSDPSWGRRRTAHHEILRRGGPLLREAAERLAKGRRDDRAYPLLIWLAAAGGTPEGSARVLALTDDADPAIRLQAIRAASEWSKVGATVATFRRHLDDPDAQVRQAAVLALFGRKDLPTADVVRQATSGDGYIRQAASLLLAEQASVDALAGLCRDADPKVRLGGVLAVGSRLTLLPATGPIPDAVPLETLRSPEEAYVIQFADRSGTVDLRTLGRIGNFTLADAWKATAHTAEQERLFTLLLGALDDRDEAVRLQAAHFLSLLNDRRSEPKVAEVRKASDDRRLSTAGIRGVGPLWVAGPFPDGGRGFKAIHPPEQGAVDLAARYPTDRGTVTWRETAQDYNYDFAKRFGPCDHASFYAFFRLESGGRQPAQLLVGSDDGVKVWHNGKEVWNNPVTRASLPLQDVVPLDLQPGSNDILVRVQNETGGCAMHLHYRALGQVVARRPEKLDIAGLADRLKAGGGQAPVGPEFLKTDWASAVKAGSPAKGRLLFGALGCVKCHGIIPDAAGLGAPSLAEARKRFTVAEIVESVLIPSKQVSPLFRASLIETKEGRVLTGLVVGETAEKLDLLQSDATRVTLPKGDVAERKLQDLSPMPAGLVKTPEELRDLLAYLLSENPQAP